MLVGFGKNGIFPSLRSTAKFIFAFSPKFDPIVISAILAPVKLPLLFLDTLSNLKIDVVIYTTPTILTLLKLPPNL
jgi:hypothetical protein